MSRQIITRAVLLTAALSVVVGCSGDRVTGATGGTLATVALIELEGARPALYVQKSDGTARTQEARTTGPGVTPRTSNVTSGA